MTNIADAISIIHVEDNSRFAELTTTFLEREDDRFTVETAARPDEGLKLLEQEDFDCVVSDYDMPGQNGIEFLKIFRKDHESRPFILFTGKGSEQVASDAIAAGVTDYLQKGGGSEVYTLLANRISNSIEQYRSKEAEQEVQERYQTLVENSPNPIVVHRDEIVFANDAMVELIGAHHVSDLEGTHPKNVIHPDYYNVFEEQFDRVMTGRSIEGVEILMSRFDGETRHVMAYGGPIEYGGKLAVQIVIQDITEQVNRERELRVMKRAVDSAGHAMYITDGTGEIQYVNSAFEVVTGYDRDEAIGQNPRILNSGRMSDEYFEDLWETIHAGEIWEEIVLNRNKNGDVFQARQTISPVEDENGEIDAFVAIMKDITEDEGKTESPI